MNLWSGRFNDSLDFAAFRLNSSLSFDQRMAIADVKGSIAWAKALKKAGILNTQENKQIRNGLEEILQEFIDHSFVFAESDEDIHTAVERRLTEKIGPAGGKLHTGRSRNDQVVTDFRLWMIEAINRLDDRVKEVQQALLDRAEQDTGVIIPGYTHTQQAQAILLSHWWLSHFWALQRDRQRLSDMKKRVQISPLGCGALAGTAFPIDRFQLAKSLGLGKPAPNSIDAVHDRDFAAEFLFWAALSAVHLSQLAEALILYSTVEFGFITLADAYSTGSSLMPQKRNPDPLELVRARSGTLTGKLAGFLTVLKGLPSAYDKDLQEDKPAVFEAADMLELLLPVLSGVLYTLTIHPERMRAAMSWQMQATDLADYLVRKGIPFREAHTAAGKAVRKAEDMNIPLKDLPFEIWHTIHQAFDTDLFQMFDVDTTLAFRNAWGGTAPQAVNQQLKLAKEILSKGYGRNFDFF